MTSSGVGSGEGATEAAEQAAALERVLLTRALASGDFGALHLRFDVAVLQRYRERGATLIRTRTVGRISLPGRWTLDVGIAPGDHEVHVAARDLRERLPAEEQAHWVAHLVSTPASARYLQMSIARGACIDDGEPEPWLPPTGSDTGTG
jgi:hypothetical protein